MDQQEKDKEYINHPSHYNSNASGIECIEIIRSFEFNTGNSFKYIFRRDEKDNYLQDIKKALWYVRDELKKRKKYKVISKIFRYLPNFYKFFEYKRRSEKITKIAVTDGCMYVSVIYFALNLADYYPYSTFYLEEVEKYIKFMIENSEGTSNQTNNGK